MGTRKVIIVDDEPNVVIILEFLLAQHGYQVSVARNGEEALRNMERDVPDIVLLASGLPYRSGFEICQIMRSHPVWKSIKIVLLLSKGTEGEFLKARGVGADISLAKPFSTKQLVESIDSLWKVRS
jgi:two-component system alkaline phosphatase synthesis response regulator PhoP